MEPKNTINQNVNREEKEREAIMFAAAPHACYLTADLPSSIICSVKYYSKQRVIHKDMT